MTRRALLTLHIVASVGLLGDCAAVVAVNVRAAADPALASTSYELLAMFSMVFGIPLSFTSLITGVLLGVRSKWGVLRYAWVATKLVLILSVIAMGAFVLGPQTEAMQAGDGSTALLIAGSAYDVVALCAATGLSVFKPRRRLRPA